MSLYTPWKLILTSGCLNVLLWLGLLLFTPKGPFPIILAYTGERGPNLLGDWIGVFSLPLTGLIIIGVNTGLAWFLPEERMCLTVARVTLLLELLLVVAGVGLILVN